MAGADPQQMVKAKQNYKARSRDELSLKKNDTMILLDDSEMSWKVKNRNGDIGYVPSTLVKKVEPGLTSKILRYTKLFKSRPISTRGGRGSHSYSKDSEHDKGETREVHETSASQTSVIRTAVAIRDSHYSETDSGDMLIFKDGERFEVLNTSDKLCWIVRKANGEIGRVDIGNLSIRPQSKFTQK